MAESVEELTWHYEEDGKVTRKELAKEVLSKGAWATVMFKFQELDRKTDDYRAPKAAIVRYQKRNGVYQKRSSFNISSENQARQIIATLESFFEDGDEEE